MKKDIIILTILVSLLLIVSCGKDINVDNSENVSVDVDSENSGEIKINPEGDLFLEIYSDNSGFSGRSQWKSYVIYENGSIVLTEMENDLCETTLSQEDLNQLKKNIIDTGYFESEFERIGLGSDLPTQSYNISVGNTSKYLYGSLRHELREEDVKILDQISVLVSDLFNKNECK